MQKKIKIRAFASAVLCAVLATLLPASCVYEGLDPCPVNLRLVYDYNMEYANAFPSKVDNITLYIYDGQGNFLQSYSEAGEKLHDEDWCMQFYLPDGRYRIVAYGGIADEARSFAPVTVPCKGQTLSDLQVAMYRQEMTSDKLLHDFFYGAADVTVGGNTYHNETIHLMCNTNNVRILLRHLDGSPIPVDEFEFSITDDNTLFDSGNNLIPNGTVTYFPWTKGIAASNRAEDGGTEVQAGFVEFSTSRLWAGNDNCLIVRHIIENGESKEILNIPLSKCLMLLKSERFAEMGAQEFLDRENDWNMVFFFDEKNDDYQWINTKIIVNGWTVRLNDADL